MTDDAIDPLERDLDLKIGKMMPSSYARMVEARRRRNCGDGGDCAAEPDSPPEVVVRVAPAPGDAEVEALLGSLLTEVYIETQRSFRLARQSGESIELRDVYVGQGARLAKAFAMLSEALANRRDKGRRFVRVEHVHVHAGGQTIVGAATHGAAAGPDG